jgi:methylthioribose-1-phosphate isomerase
MNFHTLKWIGDTSGYLELIDQRKLPGEFVMLDCKTPEEIWDAIKTLAVRGAPAIGVTAGYGVVIGLGKLSGGETIEEAAGVLEETCAYLATSRPTAVNLFWALQRVESKAKALIAAGEIGNAGALKEAVLAEAHAICEEDVEMCRKMGENGEKFIGEGAGVLTHCNAGALATAGSGTALSLMFEAHKRGKKFKVFADETRPLLQGARLTSWELSQAGIDVTVICDSMAGWLMKHGKIDLVITGADRIAGNGDAANKIGTYSVSILAKQHGIPFYVAAPSSTFDLSLKSGAEIPIEERDEAELREFGERQIMPEAAGVFNPAFDVTEAGDIAAIITERGVIEKPDAQKIAEHLA